MKSAASCNTLSLATLLLTALLLVPSPTRAQIATVTGADGTTILIGSNPIPWGEVTLNTASDAQILMLTNTDPSTTLTISALTATTGNSADFGVVTTPATKCGGSLAPLASCLIAVTFTPSATGNRTSTLSITDNAANSPQTFTLQGSASSLPGNSNSNLAFVKPAYTNASTTFSNVTGLAFPINALQYMTVTCNITWQGSATTTGPKYQFTGPASPTAVAINLVSTVTTASQLALSATALSTALANTGTITATTNFPDAITIAVENGTTAGTIQLQAAANGAGTLTIQPLSNCRKQ